MFLTKMEKIVALIGFSFLIAGCTVKISDVAIKPTLQYKFCQEQEGLMIAIDPFFEPERLKESFGTDLLNHGILPVLIMAENHHPKSGYLLDKRFFSAAIETEPKEGLDPSISLLPKQKKDSVEIAAGVLGIVAPITWVATLPVLF